MAFIDSIERAMEMPVVREDNFMKILVKFWRCSLNIIITPAPMKMFALNIACVSR